MRAAVPTGNAGDGKTPSKARGEAGVVEPKEAAEVIREVSSESEKEHSPMLNRTVAMAVAILASLLAIATISTGAATRRLLNDSIHLSDLHSKADVGDVRQSNAVV